MGSSVANRASISSSDFAVSATDAGASDAEGGRRKTATQLSGTSREYSDLIVS